MQPVQYQDTQKIDVEPFKRLLGFAQDRGIDVFLDEMQMRELSDIINNTATSNEDDISDIKQYLAKTYGEKIANTSSKANAYADLFKDDVKVRQDMVDVNTQKVVQNGMELGKLLNLSELDDEEFQNIDEPIDIVSCGENYVINGNHRLLQARLRGIEKIPANIYKITERDFKNCIHTEMENQAGLVENMFGYKDVRALEEDFKGKFYELVSEYG